MKKINDLITNAVKFINEDKYTEADEIIESILNNNLYLGVLTSSDWQTIGHISLLNSKFQIAKTAYTTSKNFEDTAFVLMLMKDLDGAEKTLLSVDLTPLGVWVRFLIDIFLNKSPKNWPSYFAIRHFMEFTIYCLLLSKNNDYIQLILKKLNKLLEINPDAEKFIGYAYFHFGLFEEAIKFLKNSLKRDQLDGEIYYALGQIYLFMKNYNESMSMLANAQLLLPTHYATKLLIEKVQLLMSD